MEQPPSHTTINTDSIEITVTYPDNPYAPTYEQIEALEHIITLQNQYVMALKNETDDVLARYESVQGAVDEYHLDYGYTLGVEL